MLVRLGEREPMTTAELSAELSIPAASLQLPLQALRERGIVAGEANGPLLLTADGMAMRDRVVAARRQGFADMLARWRPEQHPEVLAMIERLSQALARDLPAPAA